MMKKIQKNEFSVGEVFQFGLKKLKVKATSSCDTCTGCYLNWQDIYDCSELVGECSDIKRTDNTNVIFEKLEDEE